MVRHRARTRAPISHLEISIFVVPVDFGRELPALFSGCQDVHDESAMIERSSNRAVKPAEVLELGAHPLRDRPSYRGNQRRGMWRYVDDATGKLHQVAIHVLAVPKPISSWQIDGEAGLAVPATHHHVIISDQAWHLSSSGADSSRLQNIARVLMKFYPTFGVRSADVCLRPAPGRRPN